jgi:hypothetical protein
VYKDVLMTSLPLRVSFVAGLAISGLSPIAVLAAPSTILNSLPMPPAVLQADMSLMSAGALPTFQLDQYGLPATPNELEAAMRQDPPASDFPTEIMTTSPQMLRNVDANSAYDRQILQDENDHSATISVIGKGDIFGHGKFSATFSDGQPFVSKVGYDVEYSDISPSPLADGQPTVQPMDAWLGYTLRLTANPLHGGDVDLYVDFSDLRLLTMNNVQLPSHVEAQQPTMSHIVYNGGVDLKYGRPTTVTLTDYTGAVVGTLTFAAGH